MQTSPKTMFLPMELSQSEKSGWDPGETLEQPLSNPLFTHPLFQCPAPPSEGEGEVHACLSTVSKVPSVCSVVVVQAGQEVASVYA